MEMPIFDFEKADLDVLYEERYLCKNDAEYSEKMENFDDAMKVLFCENSFLKKQPQKRQEALLDLVTTASRIAIVCDGKIKILLSKKLKTASVEISAPAFMFGKKDMAPLITALFLSSDVGIYPSLEEEEECVIALDYFFFGERARLIDDLHQSIEEMKTEKGIT